MNRRRFSLEPPPPRWLWLLSLAVRVAALPCLAALVAWERLRRAKMNNGGE
jgi:hypothetical protein